MDPFYIVLIAVAVVVFIGRALFQAKKKPEKPPQPPIPVHFMDDDEPEPPEAREPARSPAVKPAAQAARTGQDRFRPLATSLSPSIKTTGVKMTGAASASKSTSAVPVGSGAVSPAQKDFTLNLSHLSPMKQAVVMAEILGTPKGLL